MTKDSLSETAALRALLSETSDTHLLGEMLGFVADRLMAPGYRSALRCRRARTQYRPGEPPQRVPGQSLGDARRDGRREDPEACSKSATSPSSRGPAGQRKRP